MTDKILNLFSELNKIPRGSYNLDGVRHFLQDYCIAHNFTYTQDTYGNVAIYVNKSDTKNKNNIIIQSHMDMVTTKTDESTHDFTKDPIINLTKINEYNQQILYADSTTLGADNGIGLTSSLILAEELKDLLSNNNQLILLITADEEVGLIGAVNIDPYPFLPNEAYVINVDSESPNEICGGSAGGFITNITHQFEINDNLNHKFYSLEISNLTGGHSGIDIDKGIPNAIKIMISFLIKIKNETDIIFNLVDIQGGNAQNAIPIYCKVTIGLDDNDIVQITNLFANECEYIMDRYNEKNMRSNMFEETNNYPYNVSNLIDFINILNHGIIHMNSHSINCVHTSTNIGIIKINDGLLNIECMTRSTDLLAMKEYYYYQKSLCNQFGYNLSETQYRLGWSPNWKKSVTLKYLQKSHEKIFGKSPRVYNINAGLELSTLMQTYDKWDCMSIGPHIIGAHSYNEHLIIDTVEPYYMWLKDTVIELFNMF
jgi:dipeptidase D